MTEVEAFEIFIRGAYPYHYRRLKSARRAIRWCLVKGALAAVAFFGAPLSAIFWGLKLFIESHANSLQDGQKPLVFLHLLEPVTQVATLGILCLCLIFGAIHGYFRSCKLGLQIEIDVLKLRTDYLLRDMAKNHLQEPLNNNDGNILLRNPKAPGGSQHLRYPIDRGTETEDHHDGGFGQFPAENSRSGRTISTAARVLSGPS